MYEFKPFPNMVSILCPCCQKEAQFCFVVIVPIHKKEDISYFQKRKDFRYERFISRGVVWHAAVYFPGLIHTEPTSIQDLPQGYCPQKLAHPRYLKEHQDYPWGTLTCSHCVLSKKHKLHWPQDAYYHITYKGDRLWAFDRQMFLSIHQLIASTQRSKIENANYFLRFIPKQFLAAKARSTICSRIEKRLKH